ncbi:hypothetical protein F4703DRAFT_1790374 [Phycomyces blakesleeanus]
MKSRYLIKRISFHKAFISKKNIKYVSGCFLGFEVVSIKAYLFILKGCKHRTYNPLLPNNFVRSSIAHIYYSRFISFVSLYSISQPYYWQRRMYYAGEKEGGYNITLVYILYLVTRIRKEFVFL